MLLSSNVTVYWQDIVASMSVGKKHQFKPNTTLNEKIGINTDPVDTIVYPTLKYFTIGIGGDEIISNGTYKYSDMKAVYGSVKNMIPFVIREIDNDLDEEEQLKYKFKKVISVNGIEHFAYYLKAVSEIVARDEIFLIETKKETETMPSLSNLTVFNTNDVSILNPNAIDKEDLISNNETTNFVTKTIKFLFELNNNEVEELNNVITLLNLESSILNEIGLCSAIDTEEEPLNVQLAYYGNTHIDIAVKVDLIHPVKIYYEVGTNEPLV